MKKIFFIATALLAIAGSNAQEKANVTFEAKIANKTTDSLYIATTRQRIKLFKADKEGTFKDTLKVSEGIYYVLMGRDFVPVFLKSGTNLKLNTDAKNFIESAKFEGNGAKENNFLVASYSSDKKYDFQGLLTKNEADFTKEVEEKKNADLDKLTKANLDPSFVEAQKGSIMANFDGITKYYNDNLAKSKLNNSAAPSFAYENHKGGVTKLEDLRGKYVYVDVWATWCGPCRQEIPFLKKMEEKYHGKSIEFVSISVDKVSDHDKWKTFVTDKALTGTQLFADKSFESDFPMAFGINSIPRFILIDPKGIIVDANAARPSDPKLQEQLDKLLN